MSLLEAASRRPSRHGSVVERLVMSRSRPPLLTTAFLPTFYAGCFQNIYEAAALFREPPLYH